VNSGFMWSKSARVADGTTSPPLTFSALVNLPYAGGGVRGAASELLSQEVTCLFGGFPDDRTRRQVEAAFPQAVASEPPARTREQQS
jgi:hypothetical protein